jgi:hypothetical protein
MDSTTITHRPQECDLNDQYDEVVDIISSSSPLSKNEQSGQVILSMPQRKIHSTSKEEMSLVGAGGNTPSEYDCDYDCECDDAFESTEVGVGSSLDNYEYADTALSTGMENIYCWPCYC